MKLTSSNYGEKAAITVMSVGFIMMLSGMLFLDTKTHYKSFVYLGVALPGIFVILFHKTCRNEVMRHPVFVAIAAYTLYLAISAFWSDGYLPVHSSLKRAANILLTFFSLSYFYRYQPDAFRRAVWGAIVVVALASCYWIITVYGIMGYPFKQQMITDYGVFNNRQSTGHVLGFLALFFTTYLAHYCSGRCRIVGFFLTIPLWCMVVLGGSRTAIGGAFLSLLVLSLLSAPHYRTRATIAIGVVGLIVLSLFWHNIMDRGLSYRPELWWASLQKVPESLWFGHGYETQFLIWSHSLQRTFNNTHNVPISVLFYGGIVGFVLYVSMCLAVLRRIAHQGEGFIMIAVLFTYGMLATATDGSHLLARPGQHWFNIWLPLMSAVVFDTAFFRSKGAQVATAP